MIWIIMTGHFRFLHSYDSFELVSLMTEFVTGQRHRTILFWMCPFGFICYIDAHAKLSFWLQWHPNFCRFEVEVRLFVLRRVRWTSSTYHCMQMADSNGKSSITFLAPFLLFRKIVSGICPLAFTWSMNLLNPEKNL